MIDLLKETLLYGTFFVCFFSFISLWAGDVKENKSRLALGLYMLGASVFFALSVLKYQNFIEIFIYLESFYMALLLSTFPFLYIYIRSLVVKDWFHKKLLLHFIPVLFIAVWATFLYFSLNYSEKIEYLKNSTLNNFISSEHTQKLYFVYKLTTCIYLIQGILYFWGIYRFYKTYKLKIRNLYSDDTIKELKRLETIILLILIIVLTFILSVNFIGLNRIWSNDLWVIMIGLFIIFSTGYLGILGAKQKNIYAAEAVILNQTHNSVNSTDELRKMLLYQFNEKKIFLKKDLNIWDVCMETHSNRTYISHLINTEFGLNFNCFVNQYRVEEAKRILSEPEFTHLSLLNIANKAGFNSLSSFNRAFVKLEKISPGKFRVKG